MLIPEDAELPPYYVQEWQAPEALGHCWQSPARLSVEGLRSA